MDTKTIEAVISAVTIEAKAEGNKIEAVIGEAAKMDVQQAVNYIQSGKAEIDAAVDARLAEIDAEGQEYVDLAKDWAIKTDGTVDGVDYSSKYYAQSILPIASDITTVAGIASDVSAVGGAVSEVVAVAGDLTNIDAVNSNKTNIDTVAGISSDITNVSGISADVSAVSANSTNINTVAGISSDVTTTAGIASDVSSVAGNATDISAVANDLTNIDSVAGDLSNIDAVNANKTNIDAVVGNATNINAVAGDLTNINSVAGDLTNINAVAGDLTNIDNASSYAAEAKQWAIGDPTEPTGNSAKYWAEEADTSETNAEIWAEGTDEEVQALGGVHSSKGWADQSAQGQVQSNWTEADPTSKAYILNKPTIPTVNNATLTIQKNGTTVKTFTANASSNVTANITVPTNTNELTNGAGFITGISSSDVTTALGYTPANDSNVVKTSGNQTVDGVKTITSAPFIDTNNSDGRILTKLENVTIGTNPSQNSYAGFTTQDSQGTYFASANCSYNTEGRIGCNFWVSRGDSGSTVQSTLGVYIDKNGTSAYTQAPTPATSDNSTKIATTAYVKAQGFITGITSSDVTTALGYTPANDSNVVKTSGNQNISGVKTLSDNLTIQKGAPSIYLKDTSITKGTTPSSTHYSWYGTVFDSQGTNQANKMSQIYTQYNTNGSHTLNMSIFKPESGSTTSATLTIGYDANGNVYTSAPTPATSDNSTKIATTAYVNNWVNANTSEVAVVVESEESGYNGYRVWSDGWIEQWGVTTINSANAWQDVTLYKPYATNIYQVLGSLSGTSTTFGNFKVRDYSLNTTTKFGLAVSSAGLVVRWYASGQGA